MGAGLFGAQHGAPAATFNNYRQKGNKGKKASAEQDFARRIALAQQFNQGKHERKTARGKNCRKRRLSVIGVWLYGKIMVFLGSCGCHAVIMSQAALGLHFAIINGR